MGSTRDFRELALVPVRGTVYVISLPFILTSRFLSILYMLFISTPVSWAKRFARRVEVTWEWTKYSAKSLLPWNYYSGSGCNNAIASRSLEHFVESGGGSDDYLSNAEALLEQRRPSSRSARKQRRRELISSLIRALLEPASPSDSDDELERLNSEDRLYQLVRELINISRQETGPTRNPRAKNLPVLDLEALKTSAKDKEKLLAFITELDEYVAGMESGAPNGQEEASGACASATCASSSRPIEALSHELFASPDPASEDGILEESDEEEDRFSDAQLELPYPHPANMHRGLSPLIEVSPELGSAESTESLRNCADLETELDAALSRLSDVTNELEEAEEAVIGARQVRVTETVSLESDQLGSDRIGQLAERPDCGDAGGEFSSIPKTQPILGLEAGHNKRDLASMRKSRPPSTHRKKSQQEPMISSQDSNCESEYSSDEEPQGEGLPHSLSDQLMLLSPPSVPPHTSTVTSSQEPELEGSSSSPAVALYSSVNKEARRSIRAKSESTDAQQSTGDSSLDVRSLSQSESSDSRPTGSEPTRKAPEMSLFIRDRVPPWKQMRSRSNSKESTNSQPSTPTQPLSAPSHIGTSITHREATPPPIPPRTISSHPSDTQSQSTINISQDLNSSVDGRDDPGLYDKLPGMQMMPPIPSRAGQEGVYDTIPYHQQQQQAQRPQYLHERIEKKGESKSRPPVSYTPDLPPRNLRMRRTVSAEVMDTIAGDQDYPRLKRSGSERRSMSAADDYHGDPSVLSSSRRRRSLSGERDRMSVSGSHHQHREHSGISRHRSSSEKHRPASSSAKLPSSSAKPVELGMGSFLKILVSPSSSKSKSSSSASKDGAKKKDASKTKKEEVRQGREESKRHRHSSKSRSKDEDGESAGIPRNESGTSLRSGVSMHSTESSSSGQDYFD